MTKETRGRKPIKKTEKRVSVRVWTKKKNLQELKKDVESIQEKHNNLV